MLVLPLLFGGKAPTGQTGLGSITDAISYEQHQSGMLLVPLVFASRVLRRAEAAHSTAGPGRKKEQDFITNLPLPFQHDDGCII